MEGILYLKRTLLLSDKLLLSGLRDPFSHTRLGRNHLDRRSVMPANFADELKKYGLVVMVSSAANAVRPSAYPKAFPKRKSRVSWTP